MLSRSDSVTRKPVTVPARAGTLLGFAALHGQWLQQLYVEPAAQGMDVGRALFAAVADARPDGFSLRAFTRNTRARLFYEGSRPVGWCNFPGF